MLFRSDAVDCENLVYVVDSDNSVDAVDAVDSEN